MGKGWPLVHAIACLEALLQVRKVLPWFLHWWQNMNQLSSARGGVRDALAVAARGLIALPSKAYEVDDCKPLRVGVDVPGRAEDVHVGPLTSVGGATL